MESTKLFKSEEEYREFWMNKFFRDLKASFTVSETKDSLTEALNGKEGKSKKVETKKSASAQKG